MYNTLIHLYVTPVSFFLFHQHLICFKLWIDYTTFQPLGGKKELYCLCSHSWLSSDGYLEESDHDAISGCYVFE